MDYIIILLKCIISFSILNVWLLRFNKATPWRGGNSNTLLEEFHSYGLSTTVAYVIGALKIGLALLLLASIFWEELTVYAASGILLTMAGAIAMHIKIKDPLKKSLPAFIFLVLSAIILIPYLDVINTV